MLKDYALKKIADPLNGEVVDKIVGYAAAAMPKTAIARAMFREGVTIQQVELVMNKHVDRIRSERMKYVECADIDAVVDDGAIMIKLTRLSDMIESDLIRAHHEGDNFPVVAKTLVPLWLDILDRIRVTVGGGGVQTTVTHRSFIEHITSVKGNRDEIQRKLMDARKRISMGEEVSEEELKGIIPIEQAR